MPAWLSPFPFPDATVDQLRQAGWQPWPGDPAELPDDGILLYDTPDSLFELGADRLVEGYQQLLHAAGERRIVAIWRLLQGEPAPEPLPAAITQALLAAVPGLLDAYLDLELKADLLGGEPDVTYRRRLIASLDASRIHEAWQELGAVRQEELEAKSAGEQEAREEAELTLLQLHQVQEELEQVFLADREKGEQLEQLKQQLVQQAEQKKELDGIRQELGAVRQELEAKSAGEQEAREEAELTLLQLHQVQEELEHYFLLSRGQSDQLERYNQLQQRSQRLLAQLSADQHGSS